jgi:hypothetical protein
MYSIGNMTIDITQKYVSKIFFIKKLLFITIFVGLTGIYIPQFTTQNTPTV